MQIYYLPNNKTFNSDNLKDQYSVSPASTPPFLVTPGGEANDWTQSDAGNIESESFFHFVSNLVMAGACCFGG